MRTRHTWKETRKVKVESKPVLSGKNHNHTRKIRTWKRRTERSVHA
jgi:hypothetical protein